MQAGQAFCQPRPSKIPCDLFRDSRFLDSRLTRKIRSLPPLNTLPGRQNHWGPHCWSEGGRQAQNFLPKRNRLLPAGDHWLSAEACYRFHQLLPDCSNFRNCATLSACTSPLPQQYSPMSLSPRSRQCCLLPTILVHCCTPSLSVIWILRHHRNPNTNTEII